MRYWVHHQGVPIGSVDLPMGELVAADFEPDHAYDSVRSIIREASVALWRMGFFHRGTWHPDVSVEALGRAAALPLELRDADGRQIPADFVNVIERPHEETRPVAFVRFRHAASGVASTLPLGEGSPAELLIPLASDAEPAGGLSTRDRGAGCQRPRAVD